MKLYNKFVITSTLLLLIIGVSCTKLHETLESNLNSSQTANSVGTAGVQLLLNSAYVDLGTPFTAQDHVFSLEENSTDESLVPTRGPDWDDNGVWRVIHNHSWIASHAQVQSVFESLNKINFDATNVLGFQPAPAQAAQAYFLRDLSLYYLLDLYGQFPIRNPGDNLLEAPKVLFGDSATAFIISELTAAIPNLPTSGASNIATQNAGNTLLMKLYLNRGMFANRTTPTFTDADMQQVITIGEKIITSGQYSYMANYFDNFNATNSASTESIFAYPNNSGVSANNSGIDARWMMTEHYDQEASYVPNAGWNGFSTTSDFYTSFGAVTPTKAVALFPNVGALTNPDTAIDSRLGGRYYRGCTDVSGQRVGFQIGQQYDVNNVALKDRKGNPLSFDPTIASNMIELGSNLEVTGIRVPKYVPDFTKGTTYYEGPSGNWLQIFRYPDVVLMVAEAKMRAASPDNAGALTLVNSLRAARGAEPMTTLPLVDVTNVDDPKTLLAERGRELYWESSRRTDLLRFGVFNVVWQYKPSDNPIYDVYPVPTADLVSNPNLKQNTGY